MAKPQDPNVILSESATRMDAALEHFKAALLKIRAGRASAGLLDTVQIDYYGSPTPLKQLANVTPLDARTLSVQPFERGLAAKMDKAIREAGLGLNPVLQGELLRVPLPGLTEERRREIVKLVKKEAEDARIAVRNLRREANDTFKKMVKDKHCSEDDERRATERAQKDTDRHIAEIDKLAHAKEAEVMAV